MGITRARESGVQFCQLEESLDVTALGGCLLGSGTVDFCTQSRQLVLEGKHQETICFPLIGSPSFPLVLGLPLVVSHNALINWATRELESWGPNCSLSCFQPSQDAVCSLAHSSTLATMDLSAVPPEYADLCEAFSKRWQTTLPPHRPYDCSTDLLSGTCPPHCHPSPFLFWRLERWRTTGKKALAMGFIHPSTSPAGAGFFFV